MTAVNWLEEAITENLKEIIVHCNVELMESLFEKAKEMEKEQIIDAYFEGKNDGILMERYSDYEHTTPEEYYNKTFKSE